MSSSIQVSSDVTVSRLAPAVFANNAKPGKLRAVWLPDKLAAVLQSVPVVCASRVGRSVEAAGMKGFPYVPWYHGDFLRSTAGWSLIEQAIYWKLLCTQWEIGALPVDHVRLAAISGIKPAAFARAWSVVGKKFQITAAGLVNERMEAHRTKYLDFRARQSEGGKKAMRKRWAKDGKVIELHSRESAGE